jgi:hypothetical protein
MTGISSFLIAALFLLPPALAGARAPNIPDTAAPTEEHHRLSAELLRRWDEGKLPAFLEDKKAQIDEVMDLGMKFPIEKLREMLAADSIQPSEKLSSLVDFSVYSSLQHQTSLKYLVENLRIGHLEPRASDKHHSRFGVYLELHLLSNPKPFAWGDVELHFSPLLLDRQDYHMNSAWNYGEYHPGSASPAVNMGRSAYFISTLLKLPDSQNELVFHERVPFSALVRIMVPTGKKAGLVRELAARKVKNPTRIPWETLIQEQEMPAQTRSTL